MFLFYDYVYLLVVSLPFVKVVTTLLSRPNDLGSQEKSEVYLNGPWWISNVQGSGEAWVKTIEALLATIY